MKIIETNFSKDEKGRGMMAVKLSMGALDGYEAESIEGFSDRLSQILPVISMEKYAVGKGYGSGASIARFIAYISLALESQAGYAANFWQIDSTGQAGVYTIAFECPDQAIGEYSCHAAFRILRSALYRQRYSIQPDINSLVSLKSANAIAVA